LLKSLQNYKHNYSKLNYSILGLFNTIVFAQFVPIRVSEYANTRIPADILSYLMDKKTGRYSRTGQFGQLTQVLDEYKPIRTVRIGVACEMN